MKNKMEERDMEEEEKEREGEGWRIGIKVIFFRNFLLLFYVYYTGRVFFLFFLKLVFSRILYVKKTHQKVLDTAAHKKNIDSLYKTIVFDCSRAVLIWLAWARKPPPHICPPTTILSEKNSSNKFDPVELTTDGVVSAAPDKSASKFADSELPSLTFSH
jgi:hypothetical protein